MVDTNLKFCNGLYLVQSYSQALMKNRCIQKGMGCSLSRDINRGPMVKGGTVLTHKCVGTETSKISTFGLQETKIFETSSFSNSQHHCTTLPCENGGTGNQMLLKLSKKNCQHLLNYQIIITAEYIPSSLNVEENWLSQNSRDP